MPQKVADDCSCSAILVQIEDYRQHAGASDARRQPVEVEGNDVSLPLVQRVMLRVHARELDQICIPLIGCKGLLTEGW
jgi:hypothetical protein